ncbi:MAG: biopolymer transporter ExbD [Lentisphaerota bacterium]
MRKRTEDLGLNMTPMIDVVFQLIIFFVTTADMENKALETKVRMAMSPHGPVEMKKDPRTIVVDVDNNGKISIARTTISVAVLRSILRKAVAEYGQTTPVVIRGDIKTRHEYIKAIMDACSYAGLWKVKFAAIKEKA